MGTRFYRRIDENGRNIFTVVETDHDDPQPPLPGETEISRDFYETATAEFMRATARAERDANDTLRHEEERHAKARADVLTSLATLGLPPAALNTLVPGLNLPTTEEEH